MSYNNEEPLFDFDDANNFLSSLVGAVPVLDKSAEWSLDPTPDQFNSLMYDMKFESSSPEVLSSTGSMDEILATGTNDSNSSGPLFPLETTNSYTHSETSDSGIKSESSLLTPPAGGLSNYTMSSSNGSPSVKAESQIFDGRDRMPSSASEDEQFHSPLSEKKLSFDARNAIADSQISHKSSAFNRSMFGEGTGIAPHVMPAQHGTRVSKPPKKQKLSHNMIEKKYRTNINSKILELREVVPTLKFATGKARVSVADLDGLAPASKLNKASVLTKADEYIKHMEQRNAILQDKINRLQNILVKAGTSQPLPLPLQSSVPNPQPESILRYRAPMSESSDVSPFPDAMSYSSLDSFSPGVTTNNADPGRDPNSGFNLFLGGLATLMGSSYIDDKNFQSLSALPLFPFTVAKNSSVSQVLCSLRMFTAGLGFIMMCMSLSTYFRTGSKESKKQSTGSLSGISFSLRGSYNANDIIDCITGRKNASLLTLLKYYFVLLGQETTFEISLLSCMIGLVLLEEKPVLSGVIRFSLRSKALFLTSPQTELHNSSLEKLNKLFTSVDGLNMFKSESFARRLSNLFRHRPVCDGVASHENYLEYSDSLLRNKDNFYELLFEWRVLEIFHELNVVYLGFLTSSPEQKEAGLTEMKSDLKKLGALVEDSKYLKRQLSLFQLLIDPENVPVVMQKYRSYITEILRSISSQFDEVELTDDDDLSDEESSLCTVDAQDTQMIDTDKLIRVNNSLVQSLNLINDEKFLILASSLVFYYSNKNLHTRAFQLLDCLKLDGENAPLSMLSFTCLLNLIVTFVATDDEDVESLSGAASDSSPQITSKLSLRSFSVLESMLKITRGWLSDEEKSNCLGPTLWSDLSDLVVKKGLILNDY